MKTGDKLAALAEKTLTPLLDKIIIDEGNQYRVFGTYTIVRNTDGFRVRYCGDLVGNFSASNSALAWCIADKNNQLNLARTIKNLDEQLIMQQQDIETRREMAKSSQSAAFFETVNNKIAYRQIRCRSLKDELSKCINRAKYWQLRGFSNETARTGRNTPNKTNF